VAKVGAGGFVGELNLLTGQNLYLAGRVREAGTIDRVSPDRLRQLMSNDGELSDIVFKALIARRELLRRSTAARALEIVGHSVSAAALALRTYAARQRLIHLWFDASTPAGQTMMRSSGLTEDDLPAVVMSGTTLKRTTPGELAAKLNLSFHRSSSEPADVTIVGAGPAGLAAAVYGASEGLATVLLDAVGTGGQAAASSRIENYFGFPFGLSGAAQLASPCPAVELDSSQAGSGGLLRLHLPGDDFIDSKAVITDVELTADDLGPDWTKLGRRPLPFETSLPGVFAVGDVRAGSMKRVAAATGEGASAIASVHKAIGFVPVSAGS
jgi:thioredoxin reductase (NADPH)